MSPSEARENQASFPRSSLDLVLTAQLAVAWAGEQGDPEEKAARRLNWWGSDLTSEYGGMDLLARLTPRTYLWASLQGAREAARLRDAALRKEKSHNPDQLITLFHFGFEVDERLEERFMDLKRAGKAPEKALPGLAEIVERSWSEARFFEWVEAHGPVKYDERPAGRLLKGEWPSELGAQAQRLVAGLYPRADIYPLPHFKGSR